MRSRSGKAPPGGTQSQPGRSDSGYRHPPGDGTRSSSGNGSTIGSSLSRIIRPVSPSERLPAYIPVLSFASSRHNSEELEYSAVENPVMSSRSMWSQPVCDTCQRCQPSTPLLQDCQVSKHDKNLTCFDTSFGCQASPSNVPLQIWKMIRERTLEVS